MAAVNLRNYELKPRDVPLFFISDEGRTKKGLISEERAQRLKSSLQQPFKVKYDLPWPPFSRLSKYNISMFAGTKN